MNLIIRLRVTLQVVYVYEGCSLCGPIVVPLPVLCLSLQSIKVSISYMTLFSPMPFT